MTKHTVSYGERTVDFLLEQKPRKGLRISVLPDLTVDVSAPESAKVDDIIARVRKRAPWILRQIEYFKGFFPKQPARKYINGESHYFLGRHYRLKITKGSRSEVKLKGKYLNVALTKKPTSPLVKRLVYEWYSARAEMYYEVAVRKALEKLRKHGITTPKIVVKTMTSRWGSCLREKNKIILNTELIKAPGYCIDYVVTHELCHLKYTNHTPSFYNFLGAVMPDWRNRKEKLEKVIL